MSDSVFRIFRAREIITMASPARAEALATFGDRVVATGAWADLRDRFAYAERVEFDGGVLLPGFNDAHMHPGRAAEYEIHVHLDPAKILSFDMMMSALKERVAVTPAGKLIRGVRYDHARASAGRIVDRSDLDNVSRNHPVLVTHFTGHYGVANTAMLAMADIDERSTAPAGGEYGRGVDGKLDGRIYGVALQQLLPRLPEPTLDERLNGLSGALRDFHAAGITSITDAIVTPSILQLFQEAEARGALSARVGLMIWHAYFDHAQKLGLRSGFGSDKLRWTAVKAILDGAMTARTALLEEPYEGGEDRGKLVMSREELRDIVRRAHDAGNRMAVHANGDQAVSILLAEYRDAQRATPRPGLRHRVEHASVVNDRVLKEMREIGAMAVPIMGYIPSHGDKLRAYFGEKRAERLIACRALLDAGITVGGSSDYGAAPYQPLYNIQGNVQRLDPTGEALGPTQRITAEEGLRIYTVGSAEVCGEDAIKGRLTPGQLADFVVLGADPRTVAASDIAAIPVQSTWVGAQRVWGAQ